MRGGDTTNPREKRTVPIAGGGPGMSAAVAFGELAFVSGQVALNEHGALVGEGDCAEQARQCFRNIEQILREFGVGLAEILQLTAYLRRAEDAGAYLAVREVVFPENPPATTTVVAAPFDPRFLVEVQVVASTRRTS
jgi:enamine deaminase RidA (YjgF/YER057c/UK114 family)